MSNEQLNELKIKLEENIKYISKKMYLKQMLSLKTLKSMVFSIQIKKNYCRLQITKK